VLLVSLNFHMSSSTYFH